MNNKTIAFISFTIGAAVGAVSAWQILKKKFAQIADEEIASVREQFLHRKAYLDLGAELSKAVEEGISRDLKNNEQDSDEIEDAGKVARTQNKSSIADMAEIASKRGYTDYSKASERNSKPPLQVLQNSKAVGGPRVITPEEFGEMGNTKITLIYHSDGVLAYEDGEIPDDILEEVGKDFADHFGEYEEDSVFVRNDETETDYEILEDSRAYSDLFGGK